MRSQVFFVTWNFAITLPKYLAVSRSKRVHNLSKHIVLWWGFLQESGDALWFSTASGFA